MAKKSSTGGGIVIIGLIVLVLVATYWYLFVTFGAVGLIVWGIAKVLKSWSSSETQNTNRQPSTIFLLKRTLGAISARFRDDHLGCFNCRTRP